MATLTTHPSQPSSMVAAFDPRIRLLWMFLLSAVALKYHDLLPIGVLILTMIPVWLMARSGLKMIQITWRLLPYIGFLIFIQLIVGWITEGHSLSMTVVQSGLYKALVEAIRFYLMCMSAILFFQTTTYGEITSSLRSLKRTDKTTIWNKFVESTAFVIGTGYQMVPVMKREIELIAQVQRARGVGITEGNAFSQVLKLVRMGIPLLVRSLSLVKNSALSLLNYAYSPLRPRTAYRRLTFSDTDWLALAILLGGTILAYWKF